MNRLTKKDKNGKYYIVEEKICMGTLQINPIKTWIVDNENRGYGNPIDKLGKLEDLMEKYHIRDIKHLDEVLETFEFSKLGKIFPSYLQNLEEDKSE